VSHFEGKSPLQHVIDARLKGKLASSEIHGTELPGHISAAADASKETAFVILVIYSILGTEDHLFMLIFLFGYCIWKTGRSAILGWSRLERMHRLIEEERWEIEHYRPQEKQELKALYAAKGFSGKLLDEVVEVLMADDNRLLQVMLEEELGLNLESHEHPLKQAAGAFIGVVGAALILSFGLFVLPDWGIFATAGIVIALAAGTTAQLEKNAPLPAMIWNLATALLATLSSYLLAKILS
jgi:hypothetical protein